MIPIIELQQALWQFKPDDGQQYHCLSIVIPAMALLPWLSTQDENTKLYWRSRDNSLEISAIGVCQRIQDLSDSEKLDGARYLGGMAFDHQPPPWKHFGHQQFILPRLVISKNKGNFTLALNLNLRDQSLKTEIGHCLRLLSQVKIAQPLTPFAYQLISIKHEPTQTNWHTRVNQALSEQTQGKQDKVVLSRQTELTFQQNINPWSLLQQWQKTNTDSFAFAIQFNPNQVFIGCSPERLFQRQDNQLKTEAVAGTTIRGSSLKHERQLENCLLNDPKLGHEHQLVADYIHQRIAPFCTDVTVGNTQVLKLHRIQHLKLPIRATLDPKTTDKELLSYLHPTPAVGGTPKAKAMDFIRRHECHSRGWYAGAVGFFSEQKSEFCVAIRSALIERNRATLYAGAGIVRGSVAEQEWQELNSKISTISSLLTQTLSTDDEDERPYYRKQH